MGLELNHCLYPGVIRGDKRAVLQRKLMARILYLELFDTVSHVCGLRQEGHLVVKTLLQYSLLALLERGCYAGCGGSPTLSENGL